jgi:hypothetical protein
METNIGDQITRFTPMFLDYTKTQILQIPFVLEDLQSAPSSLIQTALIMWLLVGVLSALGIRRVAIPLIVLKIFAVIVLTFCAIFVVSGKRWRYYCIQSNELRYFMDFWVSKVHSVQL